MMRLLFQVKTRFWNINITIQYEKRNNWKSISETFLTPLWKPFFQDNLFWHRYWYRHFGEVLIMVPTDYDYSDRKYSCPLWLLRKGKFIKMHLGSEWCRCIEAFVGFTIDLLPPKRCPYINDQSLSKFTIFCEKSLISTWIYICHTYVQDIHSNCPLSGIFSSHRLICQEDALKILILATWDSFSIFIGPKCEHVCSAMT